jgi:hypothetical protein
MRLPTNVATLPASEVATAFFDTSISEYAVEELPLSASFNGKVSTQGILKPPCCTHRSGIELATTGGLRHTTAYSSESGHLFQSKVGQSFQSNVGQSLCILLPQWAGEITCQSAELNRVIE